mgnify:CR=1 FL=1
MPLNDIAAPLESAGTGLSGIATPLAKPSFQQKLIKKLLCLVIM